MKKDLTELVMILDRSGSMGGLESDTIGGYNSMLAKQREAGVKQSRATLGRSGVSLRMARQRRRTAMFGKAKAGHCSVLRWQSKAGNSNVLRRQCIVSHRDGMALLRGATVMQCALMLCFADVMQCCAMLWQCKGQQREGDAWQRAEMRRHRSVQRRLAAVLRR